jgi:hypothetical protein
MPLLVGGVFGVIGVVAIGYGIAQSKLLPLGFGAIFLFGGISAAIKLHWNYVRQTINCTPAGFSVLSESKRRGARRDDYRWDEVIGTQYEEVRRRSSKRIRIDEYFSVETGRGRAFKVDDNQSGFNELITVFNEQTPQVPYVWIPDDSFANSMLRIVTRETRYTKTPRPSRTLPPPLPPPLPPAI